MRVEKVESVAPGWCISVLQSLMLQIAQSWIENEKKELVVVKQNYMAEQCPPPNLSGDQAALMVSYIQAQGYQPVIMATISCFKYSMFMSCVFAQETCKKLHALIDKVDEERYDLESKVGKADKEVQLMFTGSRGANPTTVTTETCYSPSKNYEVISYESALRLEHPGIFVHLVWFESAFNKQATEPPPCRGSGFHPEPSNVLVVLRSMT